ncbi:MAG TPA: hypothetical protein VJZ76_19665 [Thermoanaerobaculia bacterium]|nr:hypothetical protein [Thermoanaerobaculia bacterium]
MPNSPDAPHTLKAGLVLLDPVTSVLSRIIILQYNPDSLSRTLAIQATSEGGGTSGVDRSEVVRLKGPPVETIKIDAEIDATDQLEVNDPTAVQSGLFPQLSALETIIYPTTTQLLANHALAAAGMLEILPVEAPLILFVWSASRIVPVRITELSVTEEAFDTRLNPIRAKVSLGMRVLSVNDLGFEHRGSSIYLAYQRIKETFAGVPTGGTLGQLGIGGIP